MSGDSAPAAAPEAMASATRRRQSLETGHVAGEASAAAAEVDAPPVPDPTAPPSSMSTTP